MKIIMGHPKTSPKQIHAFWQTSRSKSVSDTYVVGTKRTVSSKCFFLFNVTESFRDLLYKIATEGFRQ